MDDTIFSMETGILSLCYLAETLAMNRFCRKILGTANKYRVLFVVCLFGIDVVMMFMKHNTSYIIAALCYHICLLGLVMWIFQAQWEKKVLAGAVLIAVRQLVLLFVESFLSCITLLGLHIVRGEEIPFIKAESLLYYLSPCIAFLAEILVIVWLMRCAGTLFYGKMGKWYLITAAPLFVITCINDILQWGVTHGIMLRSGGSWNLYYDQLFSHAGNCVTAALSLFAAGIYVFGMDRVYLEQKKNERYYSQIAAYRMLEAQYGRTKRLQHDFKNHMIAMQGLLEKQEWEALRAYFGQMTEGVIDSGDEITGNTAVDALLCQKKETAKVNGILWECDMCLLKECPMDTYDLCVLLGNLLDNAIEECARLPGDARRFIYMRCDMVKSCFLMEVKNSTGMHDISEMEHTKKEDASEHGIGLFSMKEAVGHCNGVMHTQVWDGVFTLSILVPAQLQENAAYDKEQII